MTDALPRAATAVLEAGRGLGLEMDVREFPEGTRTAADAAGTPRHVFPIPAGSWSG